jgi:hypothetical protein
MSMNKLTAADVESLRTLADVLERALWDLEETERLLQRADQLEQILRINAIFAAQRKEAS